MFRTCQRLAAQVRARGSAARVLSNGPADPFSATFVVQPSRAPRNESVDAMRARLLFQSRKRGIRENDLIFSTFSRKYLAGMSEAELREYDSILNDHDNEWDMFYCLTGKKPLPPYLQQSAVFGKLAKHVANVEKDVRIDAPAL
eukprot:m.243744 g.243744  ORF g.243744 m.243744 type:complete len:144 (+) comp14301_c0_seq1:23-454(+)